MDRNIWETIANQCAPVLMDVKPSNLLILTRAEEAAFRQMDEIEGISCICLHSGKKSTWLLYRKDRLEAAGLTSLDFAGFVKSPDEETDGGYVYSLRYEEFIPLCIHQIQRLDQRVRALEGSL